LYLAIACCSAVLILEGAGGMAAASLALVTDAAHMLSDIASYCIALISLRAADKGASAKASFGLHRVEVLGGLGSIFIIWASCGVLLYEATWRLVLLVLHATPPDTDGRVMLIVAVAGLVSNIALLILFHKETHGPDAASHGHGHSHGHAEQDMSTRATLVHVAGDVAQSAGVLVVALLIMFDGPGWVVLDPLVTLAAAVWMLCGTVGVLREAFLVLIEAPPPDVDAQQLRRQLSKRSDVELVCCFHVWMLAPGKLALSAHVLCTPECEDPDDVLEDLSKLCQYKFGIQHTTFQVSRDRKLVGGGH